MKAFFLLPALLIGSMSVSCSMMSKQKITFNDLSDTQKEKLNREALTLASERLHQMVIEAKNNPQTSNFLATDLFLKANMSLMEGDFTTAAVLFEHVYNLKPDDEFVQKKFAISLIRVGDMEKAEKLIETVYKNSKDEKMGMILAGVYAGTDKEEKAQQIYLELLAKNHKNEDACVFLAKSYALDKKMPKAFALLNSCAKSDPKSGMFDYYMGKLHVDQGNLKLAMDSFKRAHQKQPSLSQAASALGIIYEEKELFNDAIAIYKKHLSVNPNDAGILNRMVQVLFLKEHYVEVIPYAERLGDLEPDNLNLKVRLGILYTDAKRYPEAVSVFKDLLSQAPQSDKILYYLGAIHQEMQQFPESIEYFNQIPATSGLYTDSSVQMANMLSSLAQAEFHEIDHKDKWQKVFFVHVNKKMEELANMKVEFSVIKSGFFEGIAQYQDAMETMMVVQDEKSFSTPHKYYLANLYEKVKKFEEATALIMGIVENEPQNAHAWNFLGYSLLTRGEEMDKAFGFIQKALKISPDDGYIRDSLGWYYYKKGNVKKALTELQFAFRKVPDDVEILKHLAQIHREMKNFNKAKQFFEEALKHAKFQSERKEITSAIQSIESDRLPASGKFD